MKGITLVLMMGMCVMSQGVDLGYFQGERPGYSNSVFRLFTQSGERIKEYLDGFMTLIGTFTSLYNAKRNNKVFKQSTLQHNQNPESYPRFESHSMRFLQEARSAAQGNFNENSFSGKLNQYVFKKTNQIKYYVSEEETMNYFKALMETEIYLPANFTTCENNGIFHDNVTYVIYLCNGVILTKRDYIKQSADPHNKCEKKLTKGTICSCPRDFHGHRCESPMPFYCSHNWVKPTLGELLCNKSASNYKNAEYYDDSRYGIPPCIFVGNSRTYTFEVSLNCASHPMAVEGVKNAQDYLLEPLNRTNEHFPYWINTSALALSYGTEIYSVLSFLNFNHLTDVPQFLHVSRSKEEILGMQTFTYFINYTDLTKVRYGGRWYFELVAGNPDLQNQIYPLGFVTRATIDDALYTEPSGSNAWAWWQILLVAVGSVVGVTLVVLGIVYYVRKRKQENALMVDINE